MSKNITLQRYIYKINSSRIINNKYDLNLTLSEARKNDELIGLSESQLMRFIDRYNGVEESAQQIYDIKMELKCLKKIKDIEYSKPLINKLYSKLDGLIFKNDIVNVVMEKNDHYKKIYSHNFKLNGVEYCRLLGTPNGVKHNTIIFIKKELHHVVSDFINNGRNMNKMFNPAKLEAYKALTCSSSTPVSNPNGVLVVKDCITHFEDTYIKLDDTGPGDPLETIETGEVEINITDGCGMADPQLMLRWGVELGENYILPGCVVRNAFCKGAVFPVDYKAFFKSRGVEEIQDVWGEYHNINNIDIVLTESMLKLWDSYSSISDYLFNCEKYGYTFSITKNAEEKLENQRVSNYQFIQSYEFTDEDIDELIKPTVAEINEIKTEDYRKTILYTSGMGLNDETVNRLDGTFSSALMINKEVINDPFVKSQINSMISKRIDRAKIGVLNIPANYSLAAGDLYALCQSMINEPVTGLLKAGEVYSKYWIDKGIDKIAVFRAPMTSHNNIRVLNINKSDETKEFFKHITTPTVFNAWDMCTPALNGMDFDGDCTINTCSDVLIRNTKNLPAVMCIQRAATKCIPTEDDLMISNIKSFGNAVGQVTNKITGMFDVRDGFSPGTKEYETLEYRIRCGQLYQQNAIDKTKGIDCKPMPSKWCNWIACNNDSLDTEEEKDFNKRIISEKKSYFMQYIYPREMKIYKDYIKSNENKCRRMYGMNIQDLIELKEKTEEQETFLRFYYKLMPLGINPCVINRICWKIENIFNNSKSKIANEFDYNIYKSNVEYSEDVYSKILNIYKAYQEKLRSYMISNNKNKNDDYDNQLLNYRLKEDFKKECYKLCPNEKMLCNIVLDICYSKSNNSKQFAWDICGDVIIENMLEKNNYKISYPTLDEDGDICFCGEKFKMVDKIMRKDIDDSIE